MTSSVKGKYVVVDMNHKFTEHEVDRWTTKPATALKTLDEIDRKIHDIKAKQAAAKEIHQNFSKKVGWCGRWCIRLKSRFSKKSKKNYNYIKKVDNLYNKIMSQKSEKSSI